MQPESERNSRRFHQKHLSDAVFGCKLLSRSVPLGLNLPSLALDAGKTSPSLTPDV